MLKSRAIFIAAFILPAALAANAMAQSPFGVGTAEAGFTPSGPLAPLLDWINIHQQQFYRALTGALKAMRTDNSALAGLAGLSFAYGIFHAAGPGHGKAVISSYMIANEVALRRGIVISFVSALLQGLVAIALVLAAYLVLRGTGITMSAATLVMERASFALVALFGLYLLGRKLAALLRPARPAIAAASTGSKFRAVEVTCDDDTASDAFCSVCGRSHIADPSSLKGENFRLADAWSAVIAVGLRPCSGAILVMSFALLNGLYLGGVLSVLAMSLGTAITVSALALLTVTAKDAAILLAGPGSRRARWFGHAIEIAGALFVLLVGLVLLAASLRL